MYWPEEQASSLVGRGVPDAVTTGYDAQVCVGQVNYPGIVSATGKFESSSSGKTKGGLELLSSL